VDTSLPDVARRGGCAHRRTAGPSGKGAANSPARVPGPERRPRNRLAFREMKDGRGPLKLSGHRRDWGETATARGARVSPVAPPGCG